MLCDIDYFRYYNKTYGTAAGDICLQKIARTIDNYVSSLNITSGEPIVSRYGGEEFAVLVWMNETIAFSIGEHIRKNIKEEAISCQYPGIGGLPAEVITVIVGVATIVPEDKLKPISLIDIAQKALRQAKRKGRNVVVAG
ncbi:MAG: GGDEF domain-containing protein [Cyanobacteria bacterium J06643_5]